MKTKKLVTIKKSDNVTIIFGEWFDKTYGNTYYDVEIFVNEERKEIAYQYGYNAGDIQSIDAALADVGYRVRTNNRDRWAPYKSIHTKCVKKLKRELFKSHSK